MSSKTTTNKPERGPGRPKKELSPEAQRLADLKGNVAGQKSDQARAAAGMFNSAIELGLEALAQKRPHYKLSADEKKMLETANDTLLKQTGMGALADPRIMVAVTYGCIFIPRLIIDYLEYREKRSQKSVDAGAERPAKSDHPRAGEKGTGQDDAGLQNLTPAARKK